MYGESNMETYITICKIDQFSSVAQSCPTLCDPMNRSMPGLPVHHQLLEFTQTHVQQEFAAWLRKLKQGTSRDGMGRVVQREDIYVYLWLIHVEV